MKQSKEQAKDAVGESSDEDDDEVVDASKSKLGTKKETKKSWRVKITNKGCCTQTWSTVPLNERLGNFDIERDFNC